MNILGISGGVRIGNQDGAAALLVDGHVVAAAEEERFAGYKFANGLLPIRAAKYCLHEAGLDIRDIDVVVSPGATYTGFLTTLRRFFEYQFGHTPVVELVDHHSAHAACAFHASGLSRALVVTMDYSGDGLSTTVCLAENGCFKPLEEKAKPDSLGIYYSAVTQFLGFQKDSDEYKVMGMAGYGTDKYDFSEILEIADSGYRLNTGFLRGVAEDIPAPSKQERLFDQFPLPVEPRVPGSPIEQAHYDVACSAQRQLERASVRLVRHYVETTDTHDVCLAGGVALNCLMNQAVRESGCVTRLYVPPVCTDAGLAFGAACLHAAGSGESIAPLAHAYWGPSFSNDEIRATLDRAGVAYQKTRDPVAAAAERIGRGRCVGWFQGRMEYGPRALGSRSILADPGNAAMKDVINDTIKFRESFRPLAPALRHEDGPGYFRDYACSPYMTQTFTVEDSARERIPAVVHVDGTSRLQSVDADTNESFHRLLGDVGTYTDTPVVLNTSLNALDDPIACTPVHALRTFFSTGLDSLVIGDFVLDKK